MESGLALLLGGMDFINATWHRKELSLRAPLGASSSQLDQRLSLIDL